MGGGGGGGWVATNINVSLRLGFKLLGLLPSGAIPCRSLPDPRLSFTKMLNIYLYILILFLQQLSIIHMTYDDIMI